MPDALNLSPPDARAALGPVVGLIVSLDLRPGLQPPHDIVEMLQRPAVGAVIDSDYVRYDPRKRTFSGSPLILTLCQKSARQRTLFDHLGSQREHCRRDRKTERLRTLEVDHEIELSRNHYWQLRGLFTLENTPCVDASFTI
jgi:hypothetical protein